MPLLYSLNYHAPFGSISIVSNGNAIIQIDHLKPSERINDNPDELCLLASQQLKEYFSKQRTDFDLPLAPEGTAFQREAWEALLQIPFGETRSYKQQAIAIGRDKGAQAVGQANSKNPISIVIPCHRVVGSNNKLVGYAGGLDRKRWLLEFETCNKREFEF